MRHVARKRFGQHFLTDAAVLAQIVAAVAPQREDLMVEIGPGLGALTRPLAERVTKLHVIEIDRDLVARLRVELPADVRIHEGDALQFDFAALGQRLRVVGNLPYNISTPLLFHLCRFVANIDDIHAMLQREVVERMVARPSTADYGRLSVMLQYRFRIERVLAVPATAFRPAPEVESAVVRMSPLRPLPHPADDERLLETIVTAAFSQRRKTLRNSLREHFSTEIFERLRLDAGVRAQDLSVADFVRLANAIGR